MMQVSELYIYPIKSLSGIAKTTVEITNTGFKYDRRWMLVDENNLFLSQRTVPQMALLQVAPDSDGFIVSKNNDDKDFIVVPLITTSQKKIDVTVWDDICAAIELEEKYHKWFSNALHTKCKLVYMPDDTNRYVDKKYAKHVEITSFSDGYPMLIVGQSSLDYLNAKLDAPLPMNRFKPNIVFTGGHAHIEDEMSLFAIGNNILLGVKPCARCTVTTINQNTAAQGKEPLKTLATYRQKNNKIYFGQNVLHQQNGVINIGDEIKITLQAEAFI